MPLCLASIALWSSPVGAQTAEQLDGYCVQTALKRMGPEANRVTDVKVSRAAPAGYDHALKPGFIRYLNFEITIGTFKTIRPYRCAINFGTLSSVPDL